MEHLDLAGVIAAPTNWTMSSFDQQDAIYLSNSRQMLEPILEETSEDEERAQNSWNQYETATSFWSSAESETGSVIRIEVNKDPDSISERDFACPAKRARRSEEFLIGGALTQQQQQHQLQVTNSLDDTAVILRRYQRAGAGGLNVPPTDYSDTNSSSLERFLAYEACSRDSLGACSIAQRSSTGSRRFDDFYSDSDSLSYHSLSRSSSLIQFESLERQLLLQEQHASMTSLGNSSPSLISFDGAINNSTTADDAPRSGGNSGSNSGNNSRRGSQSSLLKRFESSDGRLHQTYFDLDKLNFDDDDTSKHVLFGASKSNLVELAGIVGEVKSDSESSTTSSSSDSSSSGNSILNAAKPSSEDLADATGTVLCQISTKSKSKIAAFQRGGKSSAENLSEDSGYCEPSTLRRAKSKSIPKNFEKFCEEDEEYQQYNDYEEVDATNAKISQNTHSKNSNLSHYVAVVEPNEICQPKINDATFVLLESIGSSTSYDKSTASPLPLDSASPLLPLCVKNSAARESTTTLEHIRSLAHSPSPVSSVASGTSSRSSSSSASTCASAASFTWLPTQLQQQNQPQQPQERTLGEFCAPLRNSLPDIRDAYSSKSNFSYRTTPVKQLNGYVLEQSKGDRGGVESDDSDISTSAASSAHRDDSRSDATSAESTPETRKRSVNSNGKSGNNGRAGSVPNELNRLGRATKKRHTSKSKYIRSYSEDEGSTSASSAAEEEDDFFADSCLRIRRSCSWSERQRERHQQKFEGAFGHSRVGNEEPQLLGYMNASYQNLTLLDYTGRKPTANLQENYKRGAVDMEESRKSAGSGDYESLICKGNFLLDELSEIYDKNASILNDEPVDNVEIKKEQVVEKIAEVQKIIVLEEKMPSSSSSPKPPPRHQRHSSTSSISDVDGAINEAEVQHVQLTLRKPPARQKHGRKAEETNSLVNEQPKPTFGSFGVRTFDQDPTNLRTSYAQSLEKCNFDANEVSQTDLSKVRNSLPKRRFQSQTAVAKKRNLVSSTPNLNAFDPRAEELEDDIYVSSAHTSMHQLPQSRNAKPLGILLPAGSRTSFGKEVSFCPVVSKYSWQEQSSEECNEPTQLHECDGDEQVAHKPEEESDDELLDNADATVIYNTKENEMIAARYKEEHAEKTKNEEVKSFEMAAIPESVREIIGDVIDKEHKNSTNIVTEEHKTSHESEAQNETTKPVSNNEPSAQTTTVALPTRSIIVVSRRPVSLEVVEVSHKPTIVDATTNIIAVESNRNLQYELPPPSTTQRPLSIQLPILSEPPTNRAHHILYASQQMLDNLQRRERDFNINSSSVLMDNKSQSVNNLNSSKMSNYAAKCSENEATASITNSNNNNAAMKSKFKADEKHPSSKGFLSRFANGFRFSLRRNKKKQLQQQKELQQQQQQQQLAESGDKETQLPPTSSKTNGLAKTKGSRAVTNNSAATNGNSSQLSPNDSGCSSIADSSTTSVTTNASQKNGAKPTGNSAQHVPQQTSTLKVTGKPPLPKPPQQQQQRSPAQQGGSNRQRAGPHAQQPQSQFYTDADFFLDSERSYYYDDFENQLNSGMQAVNGVVSSAAVGSAADFTSPSRASVSQKTQMFNQMLTGNGNGAIVAPNATYNNQSRIGLIETNLDTHETVISGKTRSLMDIGPQQKQRYGGKRLNVSGMAGGQRGGNDDRDVDDDDDDNDVYVEDSVVGSVLVKSGGQQAGGVQIASVRRPHKSMEFLLDKENQKNVLPPENELQKSHEHNPATLSEHQLRIQASLQRLNIPDWFRQYNKTTSPDGSGGAYKPGNFTRKRTTESGRWAGLNSKTTSLSSLGSQRSDRSPLLLSPSAHSHHGGQSAGAGAHHHHHQHHAGTGAYAGTTTTGQGGSNAFSRWSTSHLNSSQTSPSVSQRGSFTRGGPVNSSFMSIASGNSAVIRNSFRQPYLGWRSQEKLSQRTPHERLASSLLAQQQRTSPTQRTPTAANPVTPEIQTSIKEVTSAIVHYVNDQTNQQHSRSTSPNSRKCWLESSFVGTRPLDSPQTPVIENTTSTFSSANAGNNFNYNNNTNINNSLSYLNNTSANSSIHSNILNTTKIDTGIGIPTTTKIIADGFGIRRMNGLSCVGGGESAILI